jgi:hypothetical protein
MQLVSYLFGTLLFAMLEDGEVAMLEDGNVA